MSVARHSLYNIAGAIAPIAITLVTVPLYISAIGLPRYGILSIAWILLGYFGLFDFGLSRATSQRIASLKPAHASQRSIVLWMALFISFCFSLVAVAIFLAADQWLVRLFDLESAKLKRELREALPWLAGALPIAIMGSVLAGALEGRERFGTINLAGVATNLASAVLPLLTAVIFEPRLELLIGASLAARAASVVIYLLVCIRAVPLLPPQRMETGSLIKLLKFGGWTTVSNLIGPILAFWDRFVIGSTIGAAAVAVYAVAFGLIWQLLILPASIASALFPRIASSSEAESLRLNQQALHLLIFVMTPVAILTVATAEPFLHWWVGAGTARAAAPLACLLVIGIWFNALARVPLANLQARGRPDIVAKLHAAEIVPYVALLLVALRSAGLAGAAIAWSIRTSIDAIILLAIGGIPLRNRGPVVIHAMLVATSVAIAIGLPMESPWRWTALAILLAIAIAMLLRDRPRQVDEWVQRSLAYVKSTGLFRRGLFK